MNSTLLDSIMSIYHVMLCMYPFSSHPVMAQYVLRNENNLIENTENIIQSNIKKLVRIFPTVDVSNDHSIDQNKRNIHPCRKIYNTNKMFDINLHQYSDNNISSSDAVQQQYLQLPYPAVRDDILELEYKYYRSQNSRFPLSTQYSAKLEYINHYLYQGQNTFE